MGKKGEGQQRGEITGEDGGEMRSAMHTVFIINAALQVFYMEITNQKSCIT